MGQQERYRVAYLVTHPIQYQAPLLRLLSAQPDIDLTVFFQSDFSARAFHDPGFGRAIEWDVPLLQGYRYEVLPHFGRRDVPIGIWPLSHGIAKRLWRGQFDFLWMHGFGRWFNLAAAMAAKLASIPVLIRDEANDTSAARSPLRAQLKRHLFFAPLSRLCDGFLAIGTINRRYYLANGIRPDRVFPMPYCVDNDYFVQRSRAASGQRDELRRQLGLAPDRPVILYASKFQRRKRATDLLFAYRKLVARIQRGTIPYLLLAGDGETREELAAIARDSGGDAIFLGFRNQSELPALFDLCDVFVLPSEREPWGLIVNEVMNAGRAVVVSDQVGCWPDLVRDGVNGHVFPTGNVEALSEALAKVVSDKQVAASMGRASAAIIADWNFQRDLEGLRAAMAAVRNQRRGTPA